jgi:copper chaperone NosL
MILRKITRIALAIGSILLVITFFVPLWQILLWAPQYPEGLTMKIWVDKITGEIDIINGLNHYIGMKHISVEMFPEFKFLGVLVGILMLVGLVTAISGRSRMLFAFTLLSYVYAVAALWDFWSWGYEYGHNLDPNAAIKVQDMSYQPPLIGYKNLLNFTAYSGPDIGAWVIIGVCLMATLLWWWEFFQHKKQLLKGGLVMQKMLSLSPVFFLLFFSACAATTEPIRYGHDDCTSCKMTLTDKRFGAEIVTIKGKVFKFDDLNCLVEYLKKGSIVEKEVSQIVVVDFNHPGSFVATEKAFFLQSAAMKSPMRGDIACFSTKKDRDAVKIQIGGGIEMAWENVKSTF